MAKTSHSGTFNSKTWNGKYQEMESAGNRDRVQQKADGCQKRAGNHEIDLKTMGEGYKKTSKGDWKLIARAN